MSTPKPDILVVGSVNMDLVLQADRIPAPGESYFGTDYRYIPGGKGANQAAAAARMGASVTFVGRIGDDAHGAMARENLENQGVSTEMVVEDPNSPTGLAVIILEPDGQNRIMVYAGANMEMKREDLARAFTHEYDAVLMNFEIPDDILYEVCAQAAGRKMPVIIDAGPAREIDLSRLKAPEIISPNETETEALTGLRCDTEENTVSAAEKLKQMTGAKHVVIKLGSRGALEFSQDRYRFYDPFEVEVVDTTAAGDAFTAGLAVSYLENRDLPAAVRFGNAAGALAVTRLGAQPSLPNREETEKFLAGR